MKKDAIIEVGKRIKDARNTLKVQQQRMAESLGISPSHLSEIESGKANPNTDFHIKMAELYNISLEYILRGRGKMFYDTDDETTDESFDFNSDVDTLEKLVWLLKNSGLFRTSIMSFASKLIIEEETLIKESIKKNKPGKRG